MRGAGAVVRLAEPFTVRAILDHELVVRDAATDAVLAHVTARPEVQSFGYDLCGNQPGRQVHRVDGVEVDAKIQHERAVKF